MTSNEQKELKAYQAIISRFVLPESTMICITDNTCVPLRHLIDAYTSRQAEENIILDYIKWNVASTGCADNLICEMASKMLQRYLKSKEAL